MNSINWTTKAAKQLRKLDRQHQVAILDAVSGLAGMPDSQNVKALTNHQFGYRLRVGGFRVIFDWDSGVRVVEVQEVRKRDERTY
ncbi:MAG: cytotoxic translational repressor of toxin-antitoxin stability system [Candidatus Dactylopiibacterium carminicum]|uniref:Cytotoxic translational repressor of toxin-antitoxin stability system n=1 Tax=Candidatus Dactylopiibacterium carminicum TaxID=857335 RepID=A0A272EN82_9RHOO|nr:type II toxin-antitoxin system RelE/ParE family toxin [Candidatus Dactylopiibacterium carminicum]KAF7597972.1 type II toxin-antitoxin system RelE/ParE family toxin [Candidatus Dactylopiibacterium carminicum]PAS91549.1 MAG: cytotoxic translational repressor of toxin-antitoxin stability system [Candidatus Dactylopiibacterium carminicum]PAS93218.1 MAG: cytotoxic translational repressor of toxin-antitoxin stability system [Candidatus Dactylopiibacterium carminicum]PAS96157.1 MAG: cytotoxic trans